MPEVSPAQIVTTSAGVEPSRLAFPLSPSNMDPSGELDPNFEPQTRARSNTWPLRPQHEALEPQASPISEVDPNEAAYNREKDPLGLNTKKSGSRRNAWGNLSYADLISKAIQSSVDKRLTLSQIYDWMVQNVPYFKDKGDSTSSAGWKVSDDVTCRC